MVPTFPDMPFEQLFLHMQWLLFAPTNIINRIVEQNYQSHNEQIALDVFE